MVITSNTKSASPEDIVRFACEKDYQVIVYDDFSGFPMKVTRAGRMPRSGQTTTSNVWVN
jgi:hypothetical protein